MERALKDRNQKVMDSNNGADKIISDCLRNPVILKKVIQNFSNTGLLTLSLVNKLWNHEAKILMKNRGILFPSFNLFHQDNAMCRVLGPFASDLRRMTVVPFCGMKLVQCGDYSHQCRSPSYTGKLDPSYEVILDRLPWTHFSIELDNCFLYQPRCPTILLIKRVVREFWDVFEELSVSIHYCCELFIQEFLQDSNFPRLKILKIGGEGWDTSGYQVELIKAIVSRAPILQEVRVNLSVKYMNEALEGSSAVMVPSCFYPFSSDDQLPESFADLLRLERMALVPSFGSVTVERFNRTIPVLLQTYRTTLHYLCIHVAYIGPLMGYGISLPSVRKFQIEMNCRVEPTQPEMVLLRAFDFTRILPGLTTVDIKDSNSAHPRIPEFIEQENAACNEPMLDRAVNIKHLYLTRCLNQNTAPFLSDIFPNIQKLSVKNTHDMSIPCGLIWEHWAELEKLEVNFRSFQNMQFINFDSDLCGIFPEEVAELRERDDEYLKSVNIIPVKPSIASFKGLRTFKLIYEQQFACFVRRDPTSLCSRVTGLIAFARCPNVSVTIRTNLPELEEALGHMKPYATVVLERTDWNMRY